MKANNWIRDTLQRRLERHINNLRVALMAIRVGFAAPKAENSRPILFFKATSGIDDLSWNSAFQILTAWGLRLSGTPVAFFACKQGMSLCILGTNRDDPRQKPPCASCVYQARSVYTGQQVHWFGYSRNPGLEQRIATFGLPELEKVAEEGIPLGKLVLPGLRWILRRHNLVDNEDTRFLYRQYILSAWNVAQEFKATLDRVKPSSVVVFNGQFFPEATAKWVAQQAGYRVISHEVGLRPMTAFFTDGESTAYPIDIPAGFTLDKAQNARLDAYLQDRFQGNFTMGGVRFWQQIKSMDEGLLAKIGQYEAMVPVFTNVIFDTSQPHANTLFAEMFQWLDAVVEQARSHPNVLFIIRAHPDETRLRKSSLETVEEWYVQRQVGSVQNIHFIPPSQYISSYELIGRSKFVLIYNSTIGLEATLMGSPVLCAGKARFTQIPTVFYPPTKADYLQTLRKFLENGPDDIPAEFTTNARNFLYFQLFKSSLPFDPFLETGIRVTHAKMKFFNPNMLIKSKSIQTIYKGLFDHGDFLLDE